jgi:LCP family protein required for cell wall assembly
LVLARKNSTVIQGTPAQRANQPPAANRPPQPHKTLGRRRVVLGLSLVALVLLGAIAYQGWKVVEAVVQAERSAVIPWPTRAASVAQVTTSTPTAAPTKSTTQTPAGGVIGGAVQTATIPAFAPTSTQSVPTPTPKEVAAVATLTPTPALAQGSDDTSHLSVVRDILGAGTQGGDPGQSDVWGGRTSLNILVAGVDRRPEGGDQNADVLIIAHVDLINKRVAAVSIPRDLLVEIPGIGPDKINGSYNYGVKATPDDPVAGVAKVRDTIESVFGIPLDGYVLIDFNGFKDVVDSVGGVDVDVPYEIIDDQYPTEDYGTEVVKFEQGMQHMDGEQALKYVRTRHADSDDARRTRQYQVLLSLFDKGKSFSSVTRADELIVALGKSVQTSFPLEQQLLLARVGMQTDRANIRLSVLGPPLLQPGYAADGKWVYTGDMTAIVTFIQDSLNTDTAHMAADNGIVDPASS